MFTVFSKEKGSFGSDFFEWKFVEENSFEEGLCVVDLSEVAFSLFESIFEVFRRLGESRKRFPKIENVNLHFSSVISCLRDEVIGTENIRGFCVL